MKNMRKTARTAVTTPLTTVLTPVTTVVTMLPTLSWTRAVAESNAPVIWSSPMLRGGPEAHSRSRWMPSTTPSASSPDWEATGTAINATAPPATRRNSTVTVEAARAGGHPRRRSNRVSGHVRVVSSRPTTSGQTTDHMRPSNHNATAVMTRTRSNSPETRAETRRAARVLVELIVTDMRFTLLARGGASDLSPPGRYPLPGVHMPVPGTTESTPRGIQLFRTHVSRPRAVTEPSYAASTSRRPSTGAPREL